MRNLGIQFPDRGEAGFFQLGDPPPCNPSEILVRTVYSGVTNGTERHGLLGEHVFENDFPGRHGYQHVGVVEEAGEAVRGFKPGDWVYLGRYVGHRGWHVVDVGFADVHDYNSHLCVPLPPSADYGPYALLGVAGVAMRAVRRFRVRPAAKVWVAGVGLIGQFALQAALVHGAEVTVTDVVPSRLDLARSLGADAGTDARDPSLWDSLRERGPFDCILDACGVPGFCRDVFEHRLLAPHGVLGAIAVRGIMEVPWGLLHPTEASLEVSCHYSLDDLRAVLHFLRTGGIRIEPVITHRVTVDQAPAVYRELRDHPDGMLGIVFQWQDEVSPPAEPT